VKEEKGRRQKTGSEEEVKLEELCFQVRGLPGPPFFVPFLVHPLTSASLTRSLTSARKRREKKKAVFSG
jgi:hypothetical protein